MNAHTRFWQRDAVVFDLDGTLVQTLDGLHHALNEVLAAQGLAGVSLDLVRNSMHGGFAGSVQAALRGIPGAGRHEASVLSEYRLRYRALMVNRSVAYPKVHEVLDAQRARGCRLAVCTNREESLALELLQGLGLNACFHAIVGLREGDAPKPDPGLLLRALHAMGVDHLAAPGRVLMVGDSATDVGCAAAAGVACLVFGGGYGADGLPPTAGHARFSTYSQLLRARPAANEST